MTPLRIAGSIALGIAAVFLIVTQFVPWGDTFGGFLDMSLWTFEDTGWYNSDFSDAEGSA